MDKNQPWKCGDPYQYKFEDQPQEEDDSDPWKRVLESISSREDVQFGAWKEEVQNLLVFAGLFSAVTTAFLAESYKTLQPDQAENTVAILAQISSQLGNMASGSSPPFAGGAPPSSFTPSSANIRVNTLWFLSLILSLSSALVGIILLQWIREHQRPIQSAVRPRISVAILHMSDEALNTYFVYQIFTSLPLLLIFSLMFFFIGMIDFLWHLNRTVAGPAFAAIAIILTFLLLTTTIPGLQALPGYSTRRKTKLQAPCPYKSPQAWAFIKFTAFLKRTLKRTLLVRSAWFSDDLKPSWLEHDLAWIRQRDRGLQCPTDLALPLYDAVSALVKVKENTSFDGTKRHDILPTLYNAFQILTEALCGRSVNRSPQMAVALLFHLQDMLTESLPKYAEQQYALPKEFVLERGDDPQKMRGVLLDNNRLLFVHLAPEKDDRLRALAVTKYHVEICIRLADYVFCGPPLTIPDACPIPLLPPTLLIVEFLRCSQVPRVIVRKEVTKQLLRILEHLFLNPLPHADDTVKTTHNSIYMTQFLTSAAEIIGDGSGDKIRAQHQSLLTSISHRLDEHSKASDYLFAIASIYVDALSKEPSLQSSKALTDVSLKLQQYRDELDALPSEYFWKIRRCLQDQGGDPSPTQSSSKVATEEDDDDRILHREKVPTRRSKGETVSQDQHIEVIVPS